MLEKLREEAKRNNQRLVMIPIERLNDLQKDIEEFRGENELNNFQKWILKDVYKYSPPETGFKVNSLILVAIPHPMYANVIIHYQGKDYHTKGLAGSDPEVASKYITEILKSEGYSTRAEGWNLALKRLAVQSGLATYGRNNITYVDGFGSNIAYIAYFTDVVSEEDNWRPVCHAKICDTCGKCISACPTGAILKDRFLIDNERCLSCLNEGQGEFPDWLPKDVHHTIYDCLRCQEICPMNLKVKDPNEVIQTIEISEEETEMLLAGKGKDDMSEDFMKRTEILGLFEYNVPLGRNIRAIIDAADVKEKK